MKKIISAFVAAAMCFSLSANASAVEKTVSTEYMSYDLTSQWESVAAVSSENDTGSDSFSSMCEAAVLMEKDTGKVLYSYNEHDKRSIASITKIMSLVLVCEAVESGKLKLDTMIEASEHAASMGGSQIWLKVGEKMSVDDLLKASVIASANDAIVALAEAISGSEEAFVKQMNLKAKELKMNDTEFKNCSGLDTDGHHSSANDVAIMSCELLKHDMIKKYTTVWMDSLRGGKSQLVNTNKLVRFYKGTTGLKTGTTGLAGFCVSASAKRNEMELCAVILGAKNNDGRFGTAKKLLNYGFANWKLTKISVPENNIKPIKVQKGTADTVKLRASGVGKYLLALGEGENTELKMNMPSSVEAPVSSGQKIGEATVLLKGKTLGSIDIVADETVEKFTFSYALKLMWQALTTL